MANSNYTFSSRRQSSSRLSSLIHLICSHHRLSIQTQLFRLTNKVRNHRPLTKTRPIRAKIRKVQRHPILWIALRLGSSRPRPRPWQWKSTRCAVQSRHLDRREDRRKIRIKLNKILPCPLLLITPYQALQSTLVATFLPRAPAPIIQSINSQLTSKSS